MSNKILNIGIVGLGEQFSDNILPALVSTSNTHIKAVCDIDEGRMKSYSRQLGVNGYTDFNKMFTEENLDGVIAVSYPNVHYNVIKTAIRMHIPILVEKPPVESTQQLVDLLRSADRGNSSPVVVGLNFSFSESFLKLRNVIDKQELGDILSVNIVHYADKPKSSLWGLNNIRSTLLAQAIHPLGLLLELGDIVGLENSKIVNRDNGIFMNVIIAMRSRGGEDFSASIITGSSAPYFNWRMSVFGDQGVATIDSLNDLHIKTARDGKWWGRIWNSSPVMSGGKRAGFKHEVEDFIKLIQGKDTIHGNKLENLISVYKIIDELENLYARK